MKLQHLFKTATCIAMDLIYPRHCAVCGKILGGYNKLALCLPCSANSYVPKVVRDDRYYFDEAVGILKYQSAVKDSMLRYKFKSMKYYATAYAHIMDIATRDRAYLKDAVMCCVPLSNTRNRDYSQTEVVARELAGIWNAQFVPDLLYRIKQVSPLSKMKLPERRFFIKDSLDVNPQYDIYAKDILLIDDIYTSGTTANECARVLKIYGAEHVYVLCPCYD